MLLDADGNEIPTNEHLFEMQIEGQLIGTRLEIIQQIKDDIIKCKKLIKSKIDNKADVSK